MGHQNIPVKQETKLRLDEQADGMESYDALVNRMIDEAESRTGGSSWPLGHEHLVIDVGALEWPESHEDAEEKWRAAGQPVLEALVLAKDVPAKELEPTWEELDCDMDRFRRFARASPTYRGALDLLALARDTGAAPEGVLPGGEYA